MRAIEFRIWDKQQGKFIKPDYERLAICCRGGVYSGKYDSVVVDRYEIQQFTGILDKNKTPIYEGDIVDYRYDGMSEFDKERYADLLVSPVYWDYERWRIKYSAASYAWHLMEVVGSVFENPDLLK